MNWQPTLEASWIALSLTFNAIQPEQTLEGAELQRVFVTHAQQIIRVLANDDRSLNESAGDFPLDSWEKAFRMLRARLHEQFPVISTRYPGLGREICEQFELMVGELRKLARRYWADRWPSMSDTWNNLRSLAELMTYESQVQFGSADLQTIFFFSREATVGNLRWLKKMRTVQQGERSLKFLTVLERAIFELRVGIHLRAAMAGPANRRCRASKRLCRWAARERERQEKQTIPTLTAGLPCLLDPLHAKEWTGALRRDMRAKEEYALKVLVVWFGEEAVGLVQHFIAEAQDVGSKRRCVEAVGEIGGCEATRTVCELLRESSLCELALTLLYALSIPSASIRTPDDPLDSQMEDTVNFVLVHLAGLRNNGVVDHQRVSEVEARVRAYCHPV
jgi:hypothetical protein